jgi:GNAT superfamily N-acetyltransferase
MQTSVRRAEPADARIIADFNLRLAAETEGLCLEPARVHAGVAALLRDPAKGTYFVAEAKGAIIGQAMITTEWSDWRNANIWWLQSVYVRPESRRRGVFRALFNHLRRLARARRDVCCLRLYMQADNAPARRTYERLGLKPTGYEVLELELGRKGRGSRSKVQAPKTGNRSSKFAVRGSKPKVSNPETSY